MPAADYAVVVGITDYPGLGDVQGTDNDARAFADWCRDPDYGGVPDEHVHVIKSSAFDLADSPRPTTADIDAAFQTIIQAKRHAYGTDWDPEGRLYIFLAGHGLAPGIDDAGLLTADVAANFFGHHVPGRLYANWFRTGAYFREVILFMDCCRDDFPNIPWRHPPWPEERRPEGRDTRYLYGFATKWSRKARTREPGPDAPAHGYFTLALLEGLRGAPGAVRDSRITAGSLRDYVYNRLPELTPSDRFQEPEFIGPDTDFELVAIEPGTDDDGDAPPPGTTRVRIHGDAPNLALFDGANEPVPLPDPVDGVRDLRLPGGLYMLQGDGVETFFQVTGKEARDVRI